MEVVWELTPHNSGRVGVQLGEEPGKEQERQESHSGSGEWDTIGECGSWRPPQGKEKEKDTFTQECHPFNLFCSPVEIPRRTLHPWINVMTVVV